MLAISCNQIAFTELIAISCVVFHTFKEIKRDQELVQMGGVLLGIARADDGGGDWPASDANSDIDMTLFWIL